MSAWRRPGKVGSGRLADLHSTAGGDRCLATLQAAQHTAAQVLLGTKVSLDPSPTRWYLAGLR